MALSRLSSLPPSLVCLCATNRQSEWLKSLCLKGSVKKKVIFLSAQKLCQARGRGRHIQKYRNCVWVLPFFELIKESSLYRELAENVGQIWALTWGMSFQEQREWEQLTHSSRLSPVLCSKAHFLDRFDAVERLISVLWQSEIRKDAIYRLALGRKHLLIYSTERELRFWRLWAKRNEVSFSFEPFCSSALLGVIHVRELTKLLPEEFKNRDFLISSSVWEAPELRYALGFSRLSRPHSSLLRCLHWAGLVARRQVRWL